MSSEFCNRIDLDEKEVLKCTVPRYLFINSADSMRGMLKFLFSLRLLLSDLYEAT